MTFFKMRTETFMPIKTFMAALVQRQLFGEIRSREIVLLLKTIQKLAAYVADIQYEKISVNSRKGVKIIYLISGENFLISSW